MTFSILVCIKAVPDLSDGGQVAPLGAWIDEQDLSWCMNLYDAYALETALAMKDADDSVSVDVISVGPDRIRASIRRALAMGADGGIHLKMDADGSLASEIVAQEVSSQVRSRNYDLILTGAMSEDAMCGTTGPMIAAALGVPCAAAVLEIQRHPDDNILDAACEMEGGMTEIVRVSCPALLTIQTGGTPPRYPSLSNTIRSRKQEIETVDVGASKGAMGAGETIGVSFPEKTSNCRIIEGTMEQEADRLLAFFEEKGWLK